MLSPHLDDAAFSVGAFIHQQTRSGSRLVVMTVLANDPAPTSDEPGSWDLACGFKSAAVAASARREEDRQACAKLGATPVWLPYGDETYDRGASEAAIWAEVVAAIRDADTVLVPGYPLTHPDHLWVTKLVLGRRSEFDGDLGLYAEQPYAAGTLLSAHRRNASARPSVKLGRDMIEFAARLLSVEGPPPSPTADPEVQSRRLDWQLVRTSWQDRRAKRRAVACYTSQLPALGQLATLGARLYELRRGGETIAWVKQ